MTTDIRKIDQYLKQAAKDPKIVCAEIEAKAKRDFLNSETGKELKKFAEEMNLSKKKLTAEISSLPKITAPKQSIVKTVFDKLLKIVAKR